jgi:hypothetical protein
MCGVVVSRVQLSVRGMKVQSRGLNATLSHFLLPWHGTLALVQACHYSSTHTHVHTHTYSFLLFNCFEQFVVRTCDVRCEIFNGIYKSVFGVLFVSVLM